MHTAGVGWVERSGTQHSLKRLKSKPPGVARQLVTFSCFAKEKITKKKATPVCRRCAVPCVARLLRRLRNSRYALRQSSPTPPPDQPPLLGGAQGKKRKSKTKKAGGNKLPTHFAVIRKKPLTTLTGHTGLPKVFLYYLFSETRYLLLIIFGRVDRFVVSACVAKSKLF